MQTSNTGVFTDDEESATISDDGGTTTETDTDVGSKEDAVESPPMVKSTPFLQGEKVLAYHICRIYEAKVVDVDSSTNRFLVHYLGWKKRWDEWVGMDRLMKHNEENLEKQKILEKQNPLPKKSVTRGKKRKRMSNSKGAAACYEKLIDVKIPTKLRKHLVNYCERITHMGKLVKLPCSPNVDEILNLYLEHQSTQDGRVSEEILRGLRCYFNKALPAMLLYKAERQQYEQLTANQISPSKVYGAQHLLRLFVKLPEILYHANIEQDTLAKVQHKLQDFLKFLKKKQSLFFQSSYETPDGSCTIE